MPHPDLVRAYLDVRPGDSSVDRLDRARRLFRLDQNSAEGRIALARADSPHVTSKRRAREWRRWSRPASGRPRACACSWRRSKSRRRRHGRGARMAGARLARPSDAAWIADGSSRRNGRRSRPRPASSTLSNGASRTAARLQEEMPQIPEEIETKEAPPALSAPEPVDEGEAESLRGKGGWFRRRCRARGGGDKRRDGNRAAAPRPPRFCRAAGHVPAAGAAEHPGTAGKSGARRLNARKAARAALHPL